MYHCRFLGSGTKLASSRCNSKIPPRARSLRILLNPIPGFALTNMTGKIPGSLRNASDNCC